MKDHKQWQYMPPDEPGKDYRMRDRVFGIAPTNVTVVEVAGNLVCFPTDEDVAHGVDVRATPTWWEWRKT